MPRPAPAAGELLIRVAASGVGPWDALIREGKSKVSPPPPLTLGSDLSGVVEEAGPSVGEFKKGDEIYGVTNPQFCGANAQYAVAHANMVALRPSRLSHVEAASAPVIAVTARQMLFEYGNAKPNQTVMNSGSRWKCRCVCGSARGERRPAGNWHRRLEGHRVRQSSW